jgi:serine/threonine protein phosphatase 1
MRRFVIGDVHGCSKALRTLLETISPTSEDQIIFLGDYIDRGPDSRGVIDLMLSASRSTRLIALRGNHEVMLMGVLFGGCDPEIWMLSGGAATLASYGGSLDRIPLSHTDFLHSLRSQYETDNELFIHAGYQPEVPAERTDDAYRYWNHLLEVPPPHCSGKRVFVGHTPQASGKVLDCGHIVCLDTYCFGGGWLTALNVDTNEVIQASRHGHLKRDLSKKFGAALRWLWGKRLIADKSDAVQPGPGAAQPPGACKLVWSRDVAAENGPIS